ncbi:hypothetical protein NDU88_004327 [Pleurodeles waltl]|uniref:Uncharacterized protein n=1 Tax=Pleurodeles waltl TaxID=8319 RepID=A0AAV7LHX2_PLEWA|nr:hypothetical protein NDU88_004327 [Pleurodeles waltl]
MSLVVLLSGSGVRLCWAELVELQFKVSNKGKRGHSRQDTDMSGEAEQMPLGLKLKVSREGKPAYSGQVAGMSSKAGQKPLKLKLKVSGKRKPATLGNVLGNKKRVVDSPAEEEAWLNFILKFYSENPNSDYPDVDIKNIPKKGNMLIIWQEVPSQSTKKLRDLLRC